MTDPLSVRQAYLAMFRFLEGYYDRTHADEIGALLGGMAFDEDGQPMDPALWSDWLVAVRDVASEQQTSGH